MRPQTKYQLMLAGEMRPVVKMYRGSVETTDPMQVTQVVLYFADDDWVVHQISHPADIVRAPRPPTSEGRNWATIR